AEEYQDEPFGLVRTPIAQFRNGLDFHQEQREQRQRDRQAWADMDAQYNTHILTVLDDHVEMQRTALRMSLDDYQTQRQQQADLFAANLQLKGTREAQSHQQAMAAQANSHAEAMKKLELELERSKLEASQQEAALDREHDLQKRIIHMGEQLPEVLYELRL